MTPSVAMVLVRRYRRRWLLDALLLLLFTLSMIGSFSALGRLIADNQEGLSTTGLYIQLAITSLLAAGTGYWLWKRSAFYVAIHPHGGAAGVKLRDRAAAVALVAVVVLAVALGVVNSKYEPTLSGSELQTLLQSNLTAADGSPARTDTIRCPTERDFGDGDVARCTMVTYSGTIEILIVDVYREHGDWRFGIDIG